MGSGRTASSSPRLHAVGRGRLDGLPDVPQEGSRGPRRRRRARSRTARTSTQKELDFLISSSYGPGRYDRNYEERGLDYPVGYVRWTENRNMAEYLRLVADGRVRLEPLIGATLPGRRGGRRRTPCASGEPPARSIVLLAYPADEVAPIATGSSQPAAHAPRSTARSGVAVVGAGGFANGMHLPEHPGAWRGRFQLQAVVSRTGPQRDRRGRPVRRRLLDDGLRARRSRIPRSTSSSSRRATTSMRRSRSRPSSAASTSSSRSRSR